MSDIYSFPTEAVKGFFISIYSPEAPSVGEDQFREAINVSLPTSVNLFFDFLGQVVGHCISKELISRQNLLDRFHSEDKPIKHNVWVDLDAQTQIGNVERISPNVHIGFGAKIGNTCMIGNRVSIGEGVVLGEAVSVGHGATVGAGSIIDTGAKILQGATLEENVRVGEGTEINYGLSVPADTVIGSHEIISSL